MIPSFLAQKQKGRSQNYMADNYALLEKFPHTPTLKLNPSRSLLKVILVESKWALESGGPGFMSHFLLLS